MSLFSARRRFALVLFDLLALNLSLAVAILLSRDAYFSFTRLQQSPQWFILLSALWILMAGVFDVYDFRVVARFSDSVLTVIRAGVFTLVIYWLIPYISPGFPSDRRQLLAVFGLMPVLLLLIRVVYYLVLTRTLLHQRILIVGAGAAGQAIAAALAEFTEAGLEIVGFIDDDTAKKAVAAGKFNIPVLGGRHDLQKLIQTHQITTLVQAITHEVETELRRMMMDTLELGVEIVSMPVLYEQLTGKMPVEHVGDDWLAAMPTHHPGTGRTRRVVKRLFDIISASMGLLFLGLATPFIALAIYLDSPGPVFYSQERVGRGGKIFRVFKFRSMVTDAEQGKAVWATEGDSRVTRVGRLLRKTHVDEFPQFLNILRGEMSAVGPRPERPEFVEELAAEIPFYRVRHAVKPGMAGWGLINQGYGASKEDALLKLQYDLYYIKHQSLWLDILILLKSVINAVSFGGR